MKCSWTRGWASSHLCTAGALCADRLSQTVAFAGGARYRPTTSRILSMSSGSGEILKSSVRHGCRPNARQSVHAGRRDPHPPCQLPLGPVRGAFWDLLQGPHDHLLHLGIADGARHSRAGLIAQPVQPPGQEPGPPLDHGAPVDAQPRRDRRIAAAFSAGQHDPRPQRQPLRGLPARDPSLQCPPLGVRQHQRLQPAIPHIPSRPRTTGPVTTKPGSEQDTTHVVMRKLKTGTLGRDRQ